MNVVAALPCGRPLTRDDGSVLQPDVLVAPRSAFSARDLPGAPTLAVGVVVLRPVDLVS